MGIPNDSEELFGVSIYHFSRTVRHIVKHKDSWILNCSHILGNLHIKLRIAAEAKIEHLTIQFTADDGSECHSRPCHTSSLKDTGTVEHYRLFSFRRIDFGSRKDSTLITSNLEALQSVIKRKIQNELPVLRRHVAYDPELRDFLD